MSAAGTYWQKRGRLDPSASKHTASSRPVVVAARTRGPASSRSRARLHRAGSRSSARATCASSAGSSCDGIVELDAVARTSRCGSTDLAQALVLSALEVETAHVDDGLVADVQVVHAARAVDGQPRLRPRPSPRPASRARRRTRGTRATPRRARPTGPIGSGDTRHDAVVHARTRQACRRNRSTRLSSRSAKYDSVSPPYRAHDVACRSRARRYDVVSAANRPVGTGASAATAKSVSPTAPSVGVRKRPRRPGMAMS